MLKHTVMENDTRKIISLVVLNGVICPVYEPIDSDTREEWDD